MLSSWFSASLLCFCSLTAVLTATPTQAEPLNPTSTTGLPYQTAGTVNHISLSYQILHVLKQDFSTFQQKTAALAERAKQFCAQETDKHAVTTAFQQAYIAWAPLDSYQFGPIEQRGASLTVNFWPDKKNFVGRGLHRLMAEPSEKRKDPETVAKHSAAVQGFPAIERLLFDEPQIDCPALMGITSYLADTAALLYQDWFEPGGWAELVHNPGPDNPVYLEAREFTKTVYTAVNFGLIRIADSRLGRPIGDYHRNFPKRAEAWRSGLSNALIQAQLNGLRRMIEYGFAGSLLDTQTSGILQIFDRADKQLNRIGIPLDQAVTAPKTRVRAEALLTTIRLLQQQITEIIGPGLGVKAGFSAADGD